MSYSYAVLAKNLYILCLFPKSMKKISLYIDGLLCFDEKNCRQKSIMAFAVEEALTNKETSCPVEKPPILHKWNVKGPVIKPHPPEVPFHLYRI